ncbi:Alpha/beta hydrolase fold-1 [Podospora australis]|uniref:Alpha/beta hydrolase fold-1 n=1 Tax=Podospora australis TaxID=1536484 RepID=A0AAN6WT13_9PEZI|nr:Alpha/beta hydrolase fold-1 [Podospora australis]
MEEGSITLRTKPGAALRISFHIPPSPEISRPLSNVLVVFLNGLVLSRRAWSDTLTHLMENEGTSDIPVPALLTYDRYGQGDSDPDPTDNPDSFPYGHEVNAVVEDLHQLLTQFCASSFSTELASTRLVFVCNSIGCALARLYAASYPCSVEAFLFLDSMMANTDFVSLFPDPDSPEFDHQKPLPGNVTAEDLRYTRKQFYEFFHPTAPNAEHLDRRRLAKVLPHADKPILPSGPGDRPPKLVVVGHDWDEFAEQCEKGSMKVPEAVINAYMNPAWADYNRGLNRLVDNREREVKIAKGCGHFIQKDDPGYTAVEIRNLLRGLP